MQTLLRASAAAVGLFALGLQFWLEALLPHNLGLLGSALNFFSYFTIVANVAAALAMVMPLVAPNEGAGRFFSRPSVRTAITGYMIVVAGTYFLFLRDIGNDRGLERFADELMHYVTPVLFLIDWLVFVPKGMVPLTAIATTLYTPILYGLWTIVHGALTNWYPYPFFSFSKLGHQQALMNMAIDVGAFLAVELFLVVADGTIARVQRHRSG
jgi:hypothetical protein